MSYELITHRWKWFKVQSIKNDCAHPYIEPQIMDFLKRIDIKGKNVVDGGSNIGIYSLMFSRLIGKKGHVHAFEIQSELNNIAFKNSTNNNKKNITFHNNALSDNSTSMVGFTHIDYNAENISSVGVRTEPELRGQPHCGEVRTIAIDDLNIENIGVIKLDLEGSEPKALDGMWKTIDKYKPYLIIELSPVYLNGKQQETINKVISHGYSVKELSDHNYIFEPI